MTIDFPELLYGLATSKLRPVVGWLQRDGAWHIVLTYSPTLQFSESFETEADFRSALNQVLYVYKGTERNPDWHQSASIEKGMAL